MTVCPRCNAPQERVDAQECPLCGYAFPREQTISMRVADELEESVRKGLGRDFVVDRQLGIGGMSAVYLARELELNRMVAIKVLPFNLSFGEEAADRFQREAKIVASLDHPHIAPIYRVGSTPSFLWYSMKYIKGQSMAEVLQAKPVQDLETCIAITEQLGSALHYAHRRGVVHRDIKPSNVLLDEEGWAYLCDFGVAKAFGSVPLTQTGSTLGTPRYMSPEQCFGHRLDGRSDQYALAVLVFECLAGKPPFTAESIGEYVHKHTTVPAPPLGESRPDLPAAVCDGVARALSKHPDKRFPDILDFIVALGGRPRRAPTSLGTSTPAPVIGPSTPVTPPPSGQPRAPARWRRARRGAMAFAAAALGVVLVVWTLTRIRAPGAAPTAQTTQPTQAAAESTRGPVVPAPADSQPPSTEPPAVAPGPTTRREPRPAFAPETAPAGRPGVLFISTTPVLGELFVDGVRVGQSFTPDGLRLAPGPHVIRVTHQGYQPYQAIIDVPPGDTLRKTRIPLTPLPR